MVLEADAGVRELNSSREARRDSVEQDVGAERPCWRKKMCVFAVLQPAYCRANTASLTLREPRRTIGNALLHGMTQHHHGGSVLCSLP